jgi:hypothetical protein
MDNNKRILREMKHKLFTHFNEYETVINPDENSRKYSTVHTHSHNGSGFAQSALNSSLGWAAATQDLN